jgi:hypothetical protein
MKQANSPSHLLQFRLSVKDVKPEIYRKLIVSSDVTLERLHLILQVLMGWGNKHLYAFVINENRYSPPNEDDDDIGKRNSIQAKLSSIFAKKTEAITYEYDFGDGWQIDLCSEIVSDDYHQKQTIECIEGSRHGPAENTGGSRGYMEKAKIYDNPQHRRYVEIRKLIGPNFDPEAFNLTKINGSLRDIS